MNPRCLPSLICSSVLAITLSPASHAWAAEPEQASQSLVAQAEAKGVQDASIADYQSRLLDLAMDTATAIPTHPHIKDRSLAQMKVVDAAIQLDQPNRALGYADQILNWRQGSAYASLAMHMHQNDHKNLAETYLDQAETLAQHAENWRKDRVIRQVAVVRTWMGEDAKADWLERSLQAHEKGMVEAARASQGNRDHFDRQLTSANTMMRSGDFDLMRNATHIYLGLYESFYNDTELRERTANEMKANWGTMVMTVKLDVYSRMAEIAIEKEDQANALAIANETSDLIYQFQWPMRNGVPVKSRVETIRFMAGDEEKALAKLDEIRTEFEAAPGGGMFDIYLAETYTSLAEAYLKVGKSDDALELYRKAVESGDINPNSRPKAEDLSATAISMATYEVEPDEQLWARMLEIRQRLGNPW